jgi:hypothetical protein
MKYSPRGVWGRFPSPVNPGKTWFGLCGLDVCGSAVIRTLDGNRKE